ncbi:hypothetical protein K525DRAFT_272579 [Schizophyllum commune Loenen D]|nr:hypothetical protein K525DRAFT_272579 [Schizophyllum commune Loenen D]
MARKCPRGLAQCHGERVGQCFNTQTTLNRPMGSQVPTLSSEEAQCHRSRAPQCTKGSEVLATDSAQAYDAGKCINVSRWCPLPQRTGTSMLSSKLSLYPRRHARASMPSALAQCRGHEQLNDYLGLAFSKSRRIAKAFM